MSIYYAAYDLKDGYIQNWVVAGPHAIPVPDLDRFAGDDFEAQVARHYHDESSGIVRAPVDWDVFTVDDAELRWTYYRCRDDHFVDLTSYYDTCHYLRAWAFSRLESSSAKDVTITLTTNGPADVWLNDKHVHRQEHFHSPAPRSVSFSTKLKKGQNDILVRLEQVAARECPYSMALQIAGHNGASGDSHALVPVPVEDLDRRQALENVFQAAYLERDVYAHDEKIKVLWPEDAAQSASLLIRLQTPDGRIYSESRRKGAAGRQFNIGNPYQLREDYYQALLMPRPKEYYEGNMRIKRPIGLRTVKNRYSQEPAGTYTERRIEALYDAYPRKAGLYSEIARMAIGRFKDVKTAPIESAIAGVNRRSDGSVLDLVGLLGMMHRYADKHEFPDELKQPIEECILSAKYWADEPAEDIVAYWSESRQILFHACEILAGQLYPDTTFTNSGQTGKWHQKKGEELAASWLHRRATTGFREWDSNCCFEEILLALSHLVDLAKSSQVYELAAVVTDKVLFTMALNSFKGVFGSTHGRSCSSQIKGGRLEATAGIGRLMWGMGAFNPHVKGVVGLACQEQYQLPPIIEAIAADLQDEIWSRERHAGELDEASDGSTGSWEVNKVTYKTADYMLCSAQDHRPGEPGGEEHVWQATMGPDSVVFATHPSCMSDEDSRRPNFWQGNGVLPRVAQWKDVLIAVHNLPEDDWMGFTHAYFPVHSFDEHAIRDDANGRAWAFARRGEGYLAITAAQGLELVTQGDSAYRELRSYGGQNVWLCHMGRAALDGSFADFQDKILALDLAFDELAVRCATLRGEALAFDWEGPLLRNGEEESIGGFEHYESPYCIAESAAEQMEIRYGDQAMRLRFEL